MKKIRLLISTVLIFVLCISLCACGSDTDKLLGAWAGAWEWDGEQISASFVLTEDGQYTRTVLVNGKHDSLQTGTWEFKDGDVIMHNNGDLTNKSVYEYRDGKLYNGDIEYIKQGVR